MNPMCSGNLAVIGVPMDLSGERRGVDMGPSALRCARLAAKLEELGCSVTDRGDIPVYRPPDTSRADAGAYRYLAACLSEQVRVCKEVSARTAHELQGNRFPLILGGDHHVAIGSIAGVRQALGGVGLIWFDACGDAPMPEPAPRGSGPGVLRTTLAAVLGFGDPRLAALGGGAPPVKPEHVVVIGARSEDAGECSPLRDRGVTVYTMRELERLGMKRAIEQAIGIATQAGRSVHVSFNLNALDPYYAPGVGTSAPGGIAFRESHLAMERLAAAGVVSSADIVEVNPIVDTRNQTATTAVALLCSLFGERQSYRC
ncbi:arginase [Paenibacillus chartarius]|uniref:Arginase n=1 Tax=Paenibacillus chartarius TaxID=747481 RepID=A0ABV6DMV2_9BACL